MADGTTVSTEVQVPKQEVKVIDPPLPPEKKGIDIPEPAEEQIALEGTNNPNKARSILEIFTKSVGVNVNVDRRKIIGYKKNTDEDGNKEAEYKIKSVEINFKLGDELTGEANQEIQELIDSQDKNQKALGIDLRLAWLDQNLPKIEKKWQGFIKDEKVTKENLNQLKMKLALESKILQEKRDELKDEKGQKISNQVTELAKTLVGDRASQQEKDIKTNPLAFIEKQLNEASGSTEKSQEFIEKVRAIISQQPEKTQEACEGLPDKLLGFFSDKEKTLTEKHKQDFKETGKKSLKFVGGFGALLLLLGWTAAKKSSEQGRQ